jgi:hypothetical protein
MALAFIAALAGAATAEITVQLVAEASPDARRRQTVHHWSLSVPKLMQWLIGENTLCGMAVFVMVNAGDLQGRRSENVTSLRALFVDDDKGLLPPDSMQLAALPPTLTVRTRKGWHHYWVLVPGEALSAFTSAQAALAAHFRTDPAVKDLARVMRLPGFLHQKDPSNPVLVQLVRAGSERYRIADVLKAYPAPQGYQPPARPAMAGGTKSKRRRKQGLHTAPSSRAEAQALLVEMLRHSAVRWAEENPDEVSREVWRGLATNLSCAAVDHPDLLEAAWREFNRISAEDPERYREADARRAWLAAIDSVRAVGPMGFRHMVDHGLPGECWSAGASSLIHAARLSLRARGGGAL